MVSDGGELADTETAQWALRFISGKYQGGEFPLRPHREIIIGRSSDLDMVLVEDMVSRKHAKITTDDTVGHDPGPRLDERHVRQRREDPQGRAEGRRPHPDRHVDHQARLRRRRERPTRLDARPRRARRWRRPPTSASRAEVDVGQHRGDPAARPAAAAVDQPQVGRAGDPHRRATSASSSCARGRSTSRTSTTASTSARGRRIFRMLSWAPGSFELEPPDEIAGARGDAGVDRGAADGGHAPARRVPRDLEKLPPLRRRIACRGRSSPSCASCPRGAGRLPGRARGRRPSAALFDQSPLTDLAVAEKLVALLEKGYLGAG